MQAEDGSFELKDAATMLGLLGEYRTLAAARSPPVDLAAREIEVYTKLKAYLTVLSQQLAQHAHRRQHFVDSALLEVAVQSLSSLYPVFEQAQKARPSSQEEDGENAQGDSTTLDSKEQQQDPYYRVCHIATLYMRILRNGMAGCADAQSLLCRRFDLLAPFLANVTRFHTLNDPDTLLLSRSAVQMLSNLITANQEVQRQMWPRIVTTDTDDDRLVLKFLSSPHTATQSAAQILLINFIRTPSWVQDAQTRCYQLCTGSTGLQLIQSLLSSSESIMLRTASTTQDGTDQEPEPESEIQGLEESLGFIYTVFAILFEAGYASLLLSALAPFEEISSTQSSPIESDLPIVSSSQLTLLKLLDSWLHLSQKQVAESCSSSSISDRNGPMMRVAPNWNATTAESDATRGAGLAGLVEVFMRLSAFARSAMSRGIAKDGVSADQQPQDPRLIGVHHGLLLLLQSLLSISLTADGWSDVYTNTDESAGKAEQSFGSLSRALLSAMRRNQTFVDELVELLDQTHQYAPALSPFRPTDTNSPPGDVSAGSDAGAGNRPLPQGHALSSTGKAANEAKGAQPSYGFDHLKRDIVRVLGSLVYAPTHSNSDNTPQKQEDAAVPSQENHIPRTATLIDARGEIRSVQDRVREKGGLYHVLNMTVLDERNPYMREHAILALRYLLAANVESQNLVAALQPKQPQDRSGATQLRMV